MSSVNVKKVANTADRTLPVFAEADELLRCIRNRAFALFANRGFGDGRALEDWLAAEHEICWPTADFTESDKDCVLEVAVPGYEPAEIDVTVTPREIIVHAGKKTETKDESKRKAAVVRWTDYRANDVYRRVELFADIDVKHVTASLKNGILKIVAPKLESPATRVMVAAAA